SINITVDQVTDLDLTPYATNVALSGLIQDFTGHTGETGIHYTVDEIFIPVTQLDAGATASGWVPTSDGMGNVFWSYISGGGSDITEPVFNAHVADFTGHTGDPLIHFTVESISHGDILEIGVNDHDTIDTHLASTSNPHSVTIAQVGGIASGVVTGHTGDSSIHFTQDDIFIPVTQLDPGATASGWVPTSDGLGNVFWSYISGGGSGVTEPGFNAHVADFTGHTGDTTIHFTQAEISITESQISDLQDYLLNVDGLSGDFTGHTGDTGVHYSQAQINISTGQLYDIDFSDYALNADLDAHTTNTSNPHAVTAAQVGAPTTSEFNALQDIVTGHTGNTGIHYTQGQISISSGQLYDVDFSDYALASDLSSHTSNTSNPHSVTAAQVGSPTTAQFTALSGVVTGHTGLTNIHFTEASIDHRNINAIGSYQHADIDLHIDDIANPHAVTASQVGAPTTAQFTGHTGAEDPHTGYLLANGTRSVAGELTATIAASDPAAFIRKNESDLGDLTNYLFVQSVSEIFTGHSGDTSIHYTQASISIPLSQ
ncbi:MAG: hypothetical protein KDH96_11170, partial [Candidatus Riesia sp.]|nr:hypothetical protein [Candidatus Riesia sp.]